MGLDHFDKVVDQDGADKDGDLGIVINGKDIGEVVGNELSSVKNRFV